FDKILVTTPTSIFTKIAKLPKSYVKRLNSIQHLSALVLVLTFKKPFFPKNTYWLNITNKDFPFLVMAEHTNFMDKKNYGNQHILYIGNYLSDNHPYLKLSAKQLFAIYKPFLKKINPDHQSSIINHQSFSFPNAQPVVTTKYPQQIPTFQTPLKNIYLANMDMVYPWDRGVNYAIELGEKAAKILSK
ncbi:MAG: oxidoreductase, partial [Candidatus Daviesbacteria bacterium]|nr:oxidoreductase [Candidatus Daviesbacteria bacterium]